MENSKERRVVTRTTQLTLIRLQDVIKLCGLSRSSIYGAIKAQQFPAPVAIGGRARAWIKHEVENWIGQRIRATRDHPSVHADDRSALSRSMRMRKMHRQSWPE